MENNEEGKVAGGQVVCDTRLADDQGMVSSLEENLQRLMYDTVNRFNKTINIQKTKTMVFRENGGVVLISQLMDRE
jgi:hypothetical protein